MINFNVKDAKSSIQQIDGDNIDNCYTENIDKFIKYESISYIRKKIFSFTWPCLLELLSVSLISIVNMIMVGHLGAYAISAIGITTQPILASIAIFQAFNTGATTLISRFIGSENWKGAKDVVIQTLFISILSVLILSIIGYVF